MTKGLKQMAAEAAAPTKIEPIPVDVSGEALRAYAFKVREWSGWPDASLVFGKPVAGSPYASCEHDTRTFRAEANVLVLNPHRVLHTVTPFRFRQEAVLTGALIHEAGHARFSHWQPGRYGNPAVLLHSDDGSGDTPEEGRKPVSKQALSLARLMEEPRVEGLMAAHSGQVGVSGLEWTLRASAAALLPMTALAADPGQQIMDLITSWALRAGRQIALRHWINHETPTWVQDFTSLLHQQVAARLEDLETDDPWAQSRNVMDLLISMVTCTDNTGTTMVDKARDVLDILFPETTGDEEDAPEPSGGCGADEPPMTPEEEEEQGQPEPEQGEQSDEGEEGATDCTDEEADSDAEPEGDADSDSDEGEGDADSDSDEGEGDAEGEAEGEPEGEPEAGEIDAESDLAKALRALEEDAKDEVEQETEDAATTSAGGGEAGTSGPSGDLGGGYRLPTKPERDIAKGAESFLRSLIEPTEQSKTSVTDTPSSQIDGAAHAAWLAGGRVRAPHFFKQTKRAVEPSPPVKIAILVDVSGSMEELQAPSAVLSWALSSAALDLRNFAGRGQQIESCLIHWGSTARVIQRNGEQMPGLKEFGCFEGTSALHDAMDLVEEEMPGFFDTPEAPVNRLLVQFTDWELPGWTRKAATKQIGRALASGVNMLSVVPQSYSVRHSHLPVILAECKTQRGKSSLMRYNPLMPQQVWDHAAENLG